MRECAVSQSREYNCCQPGVLRVREQQDWARNTVFPAGVSDRQDSRQSGCCRQDRTVGPRYLTVRSTAEDERQQRQTCNRARAVPEHG